MPQRTRQAEGFIIEVYPKNVLAMVRYVGDRRDACFQLYISREHFLEKIPLGCMHVAAVLRVYDAACVSAQLLGDLLSEGYVKEVRAQEVVIQVNYLNSPIREDRTVPHSAFAPGSVIWPRAPIQVHGELREGGYTVRVYVPPDHEPLIFTIL